MNTWPELYHLSRVAPVHPAARAGTRSKEPPALFNNLDDTFLIYTQGIHSIVYRYRRDRAGVANRQGVLNYCSQAFWRLDVTTMVRNYI